MIDSQGACTVALHGLWYRVRALPLRYILSEFYQPLLLRLPTLFSPGLDAELHRASSFLSHQVWHLAVLVDDSVFRPIIVAKLQHISTRYSHERGVSLARGSRNIWVFLPDRRPPL